MYSVASDCVAHQSGLDLIYGCIHESLETRRVMIIFIRYDRYFELVVSI